MTERRVTDTSYIFISTMVKKVKPEKPPAIDKLLIPAVGVVIAFVAFYFMKGLNSEVRFQC